MKPVPTKPVLCKPVLFVTGHAPADRVGLFARLHEREQVEFALFGGPSKHGVPAPTGDQGVAFQIDDPGGGAQTGDRGVAHPPDDPFGWEDQGLGFPHRYVSQRDLLGLIASGRHRAVICSTGGRLALPLTWAATRGARLPLILWTSLWAHPRSVAHAFSYPALARLYRSANAIVTYGPHVSAYVRARGARNVHVAAQAVDNDFWSATETDDPPGPSWPSHCTTRFLFVGRPAREKGAQVLMKAWEISGLRAPAAALVLVGVGPAPRLAHTDGAVDLGRDPVLHAAVDAIALRRFYARADVLVVPSIQTATFREPWGLVVNEAMNQRVAIISSDAVGAAAGGLVRDRRNGLIFPAGDSHSLARSLRELACDGPLRERLAAAGSSDVRAYTADAWASGFSDALASVGLSRSAVTGRGADGALVA